MLYWNRVTWLITFSTETALGRRVGEENHVPWQQRMTYTHLSSGLAWGAQGWWLKSEKGGWVTASPHFKHCVWYHTTPRENLSTATARLYFARFNCKLFSHRRTYLFSVFDWTVSICFVLIVNFRLVCVCFVSEYSFCTVTKTVILRSIWSAELSWSLSLSALPVINGWSQVNKRFRRLADENVHCAGSATYQICFKLPNPNPYRKP